MATASAYICTLCEADDISNEAVRWCLECEEWLCTDCNKHHGRSKLSKQHKTITVYDYNLLPASVLRISNKCCLHHEKLELFCSFHDIPCCIHCNSDEHNECTLRPISGVLENIKTSPAISSLEEDLLNINENLETIARHLADKEIRLQEQKIRCLQEVRKLRKQLNDHLDVIEKRLTDELISEHNKLQTNISTLNNQIQSRKAKIKTVIEEFTQIKQCATNLQLFLAKKNIEKELYHESKYVEGLIADDCKEDNILRMEISPVLRSLQNDVTSFGKIFIDSIPTTLEIKLSRQYQAQLSVPMATRINQIKVQKNYSIQLSCRRIVGCAIMSDGQCVFADFDKECLSICNSEGVKITDVDLCEMPADVCLIKDSVVAVSLNNAKKIIYIDVTDKRTITTIFLEDEPYGVDSNGSQIIVACLAVGTIVITDMDGRITNRIKTALKNLIRVCIWQDKIFCTDWKADKILGYDTKGNLMWTYQDERIQKPKGIAVDKRGFVYVAAEKSNKLIVLNHEGTNSKVLLDENDGLNDFNCVSIYNDRILLCNRHSGLGLYSLSH